MAARFCRRGAPLEDLIQVASIGLIQALDRYDPHRGVKFTTYAVSTIVGEIKHYFRDCTWSVKVPRQLQEIAANLARVDELLSRKLGHSPTVSDLAAHFGVSEEEISEAIELDRGQAFASQQSTVGSRQGVGRCGLVRKTRWHGRRRGDPPPANWRRWHRGMRRHGTWRCGTG